MLDDGVDVEQVGDLPLDDGRAEHRAAPARRWTSSASSTMSRMWSTTRPTLRPSCGVDDDLQRARARRCAAALARAARSGGCSGRIWPRYCTTSCSPARSMPRRRELLEPGHHGERNRHPAVGAQAGTAAASAVRLGGPLTGAVVSPSRAGGLRLRTPRWRAAPMPSTSRISATRPSPMMVAPAKAAMPLSCLPSGLTTISSVSLISSTTRPNCRSSACSTTMLTASSSERSPG